MNKHLFLIILSIAVFTLTVNGQVNNGKQSNPPPQPQPPPPPAVKINTEKLSETITKNLENLPQDFETTRENRQKAYAKLLEGQRYIWTIKHFRSSNASKLAKVALQQAIEFDPMLAEAYTALGELNYYALPQDINEAIKFGEIAVKMDKNNFGGHHLLARLFTIKSNIGYGRYDDGFAQKAITQWREIVRLSPRFAEAWAVLSAFYKATDQNEKRINALQNWVGAAEPLDESANFYKFLLPREGELSSEIASMKLGETLLEDGRIDEAVSILAVTVSDSPQNFEAIELLSQALENAEGKSLKPAVEALRQAVYANPNDLSLNELLAKTIAKAENVEEAAKYLKSLIAKLSEKDKLSAASFQVSIGDIYAEAERFDEAVMNYREALKIRGFEKQELATDDERDFAFLVVNKLIEAYKKANRFEEAKKVIADSRPLFGEEDTTLDREYITVLRESGKKEEALKAVRTMRVLASQDYNLIRTEASILTDLGKVDEAVALIKTLIEKKPQNVAPSIMYEDFQNYLFISSLYLQAKRNKDAIDSANKAISAAKGKDSEQFGYLILANAYQSDKNFTEAEKILRRILEETPFNPMALNNLGYLFLEKGSNFEDALHFIQKAVVIEPRNPNYLDSLGWAYFKLGKFAEAEKYLVKASKYDPTSATILEHLGDVYLKNGKTQEAVKVWKKALALTLIKDDIDRLEQKIAQKK